MRRADVETHRPARREREIRRRQREREQHRPLHRLGGERRSDQERGARGERAEAQTASRDAQAAPGREPIGRPAADDIGNAREQKWQRRKDPTGEK